jgi:hypothetical protein
MLRTGNPDRGFLEPAPEGTTGPRTDGPVRPASIWRRRRLIALAVGLALFEWLVLRVLGLSPELPLAPQVTAPVPFGAFHDLRWILVFHRSWPTFAWELTALVVVRGAITALFIREAWPVGLTPPAFRWLFPRTVVFTAIAVVILSPWATMLFAFAVAPVSWLFFGAFPAVLLVAVLIHSTPIAGEPWRHRPPLRSSAWVLLTALVLSLSGGLISVSPSWLVPVEVAATGLFNAWVWASVVHIVAMGEIRRRRLPLPSFGIALVLVVVVGLAAVGLGLASEAARQRHQARAAVPERGKPVLLVHGFASRWDGAADDPLSGPYREQRFSYRGTDAQGHPLPYGPGDTYRSLGVLADSMSEQVEAFHRETGQPVAIVADSEGTIVATDYLSSHPNAPVDQLVLVDPLLDTARVYYPPAGEQGQGVATGWELRGLATLVRWISPMNMSADSPLVRSILRNGPRTGESLGCLPSGTRVVVFDPLADAVGGPLPGRIDATQRVLPAFHGGVLGSKAGERAIRIALSDGAVPSYRTWDFMAGVLRAGTAAWQSPSLPAAVDRPCPPAVG